MKFRTIGRSAALFWFALLCSVGVAHAVAPVNETFFGVAIHGYDPVAYFDEGAPREGSKEHTLEWRGATWRFASAEHLERFRADPESFAPQYGGYCAYAVSQGATADGDPELWAIVDGKLYLNLNPAIQKRWDEDRPGYIQKGDRLWPGLVDSE
ncbi:MAG: YHS domain-containing (seleno)protein [Myxococcota bacterium]